MASSASSTAPTPRPTRLCSRVRRLAAESIFGFVLGPKGGQRRRRPLNGDGWAARRRPTGSRGWRERITDDDGLIPYLLKR